MTRFSEPGGGRAPSRSTHRLGGTRNQRTVQQTGSRGWRGREGRRSAGVASKKLPHRWKGQLLEELPSRPRTCTWTHTPRCPCAAAIPSGAARGMTLSVRPCRRARFKRATAAAAEAAVPKLTCA